MISFPVINLLIPGNPEVVSVDLPTGTWKLERHTRFDEYAAAIATGRSAPTYFLEYDGPASDDDAFQEVTPFLLGASYATGHSVTIHNSTPMSDIQIAQPTNHWPRDRSGTLAFIINNETEFLALVEKFVAAWPLAGKDEKVRLLVHHWLDGMACWSMEDLYLSATTLLQIIAATESDRQGKDLSFFNGVSGAAARMGIRSLSADFKNMRNELIHDGQLIGTRFAGPDVAACAAVTADVLNWFDEYIHSALQLGHPRKTRFCKADFMGLNAYSID